MLRRGVSHHVCAPWTAILESELQKLNMIEKKMDERWLFREVSVKVARHKWSLGKWEGL